MTTAYIACDIVDHRGSRRRGCERVHGHLCHVRFRERGDVRGAFCWEAQAAVVLGAWQRREQHREEALGPKHRAAQLVRSAERLLLLLLAGVDGDDVLHARHRRSSEHALHAACGATREGEEHALNAHEGGGKRVHVPEVDACDLHAGHESAAELRRG